MKKRSFPPPPKLISPISRIRPISLIGLIKKKRIKKRLFGVLFGIFFLGIFLVSSFFLLRSPARASWFNDQWLYRQSIPVTNNTSVETNVYIQATVNISATSKAQADDGDFRFTLASGQTLPYFVSSGVGTTAPVFHIKIASFPAGAQTFYAYYGNSSASNGFQASDFSTVASNYTVGTLGTEENSPGPVAYFKFDEGYGGTAYDSTSNANNATLGVGSSAPTWTTEDQCISGKCLQFNGTNNYASVADNTTLRTTGDWTRSLWVKSITAAGGDGAIHDFWTQRTTTNKFLLRVEPAGSWQLFYQSTGGGFSNITFTRSPNVWQQITVTKSGTNIIIYVDGKNVWNATNAENFANDSHQTFFGSSAGLTQFFPGFIDDVKIYAYARTLAQVKADYNSGKSSSAVNKGSAASLGSPPGAGGMFSNGLVGYWKIDETSGNASDSSGNAYTLTNNNTTPFNSGKFGNAPTFNGTSMYFNIGTTIPSVQTISFWAKPASTTDNFINLTSSAYINSSSGTLAATGVSPSTIYVNGIQSSSISASTWQFVTITTTSTITINTFEIGRANSAYAINNSQIDDIRLYNRALSPKEISDLYAFAPGPVAQWKMEEGSGTSANDSSGNGITGTLGTGSSSPSWTTGKYGKGLQFDGTNDYLNVNDNNALKFGSGDFTVSTWIKTATATDQYIVEKDISGCSNASWLLGVGFVNSGKVSGIIGTTSTSCGATEQVNGSTTVSDGNWHHIALVRSSSGTNYIYVDGKLDGSNTNPSGSTDNTQPITIGGSNNDSGSYSGFFNGQIDNVQIYNYARTQKQVVADMNAGHPNVGSPVGSPIVYLKFNEGYGTTAHTSGSDKNLNGTLSGTTVPSWTSSGKFGKALTFNGASSYVSIGNSAPAQITGNITLSAWINLGTNNAVHDIIAKDGASGNYGYRLFTDANGKLNMEVSLDGTATTLATGASTLSTATWYHVLGTYIPSTSLTVYLNGKSDGSNTTSIPASIFNSSANLEIGAENVGASNLMQGTIDDVKVYNYDLNSNEVKLDYNKGSALQLGSIGAGATYLAYDTFTRADGALGSTENTDPNSQFLPAKTWTGSTWTVSSNKAINTPTLGSEQLTNGDFEGSFSGGLAANWSQIATGTPSQETTIVHGGLNSQKFVGVAASDGVLQYPTQSTGQWYQGSVWVYVSAGSARILPVANAAGSRTMTYSTASWSKFTATGRKTGTVGGINVGQNGATAATFYVDDASIIPLTLSSLFSSVNTSSANVTASVDLTFPSTTTNSLPAGVVLNLDSTSSPANFVIAYHDGGNVHLDKAVNGTYTALINTAAAYSAGATIKVVKNDTSYDLYYNGTQRGTTQTITDKSIVNNTMHGLFSTYSATTLDNFTLLSQPTSSDYCAPGETCAPPIGEWNFEEGTGTSANDTSGNTNTGTLGVGNSAPSWTTGKIGKGLQFDGVNDFVGVSTTIPNTQTISFWIKPTSTTASMVNLTSGAYITASSGTISATGFTTPSYYINGLLTSTPTLTVNTWNHIVVTTGTSITANAVTFGKANNAFAGGIIDNVKFYAYARSQAQIAWDYNNGKPIAWYKMDECQGTTIHSTNNPYDSTLNGTLTIGATGTQSGAGTCTDGLSTSAWNNGSSGKFNASVNFDGVDDYVSVADSSNLLSPGTGNHTISMWVKNTVAGNQLIYHTINANSQEYIYILSTGKVRFNEKDSSGNELASGTFDSTGTVNNGSWHLITTVWDTDNNIAYIYIDGKLDSSTTSGASSIVNVNVNSTKNIGRNNNGTAYYSGQIDDVQIYNYALTSQQIKLIYNQNSAVRFGPNSGNP